MTQPDIRLDSQVAVITGGGGGIGRAIALAFASAGADIVTGDIVPERCDETSARVSEMGRRALGIPTDVMDTNQIRALVDAAASRFGRIDILVNNAGGVTQRPFLEQSERSWRRHIDINLVSMLAATSAAVPVIIAGKRGGSVINVTSIEASRAAPNYAVYAACKAGMVSFTRTMALELAEHGIRVNAIAPDLTVTPGVRGNHTGLVDETRWIKPSAKQKDATARRIPLGREGVAEECGNVALFLASPMSSYVTGSIMPVDGGTWASAGWVRNRVGKWVLVEEHADGSTK
jgi:NAD(P)-dependent dehydrogenase (short-subunit alcohol dehydrogenase family)